MLFMLSQLIGMSWFQLRYCIQRGMPAVFRDENNKITDSVLKKNLDWHLSLITVAKSVKSSIILSISRIYLVVLIILLYTVCINNFIYLFNLYHCMDECSFVRKCALFSYNSMAFESNLLVYNLKQYALSSIIFF